MIRSADLIVPFSEERRPVLFEELLVIPYRADLSSFAFPCWSAFYGNVRPVHIEYCSGNGSWIVEQAKNNPSINYLACEMKLVRAKKIWAKAKGLITGNLRVALAEGFELSRYIPSSSVEKVYVNFPDPWPKRRHGKNRLIQPAFVQELARILSSEGRVVVVTDDVAYSEICIKTFMLHGFHSALEAPYYQTPPENYGSSFFEALFKQMQKSIRYHEFVKRI